MPSEAHALSVTGLARRWGESAGSTPLLPTWSTAAAMRAARATIVIPGLFALTDVVIGNLQMATFAAFGGFATLVLTSFAGTRRDKLIAHAALAVAGTILVAIGTLVSSATAAAAIVTVPVTFAVFFAGVAGPNAASGVTGALLAYVLPAASPETVSMIPDRLVGWWLASVVGTAAVLVFSPPGPASELRRAASKLADALATEIDAVLRGQGTQEGLAACIESKHELLASFTATPYRPTGLASTDQALANTVELLEWCTSLLVDTVHERGDLRGAAAADRELMSTAASVLRDTGPLLAGDGETRPDLEHLDQCRRRSIGRLHRLNPQDDDFREQARVSFHACAIAVTVLVLGADALVAARLADAKWVAEARARWFGDPSLGPHGGRRLNGVSRFAGIAIRHASARSVWFINSLRGALALAAAVAVADLTTVQHGFWVVLGTLSVLRTNAASTGSTALRALTGSVLGFVIGGALLLAIGTGTTALWVALPIAVFVAAYAPGTAPFVVGQAAFTVLVAVLFNLLVPVGWKVGVVRVEDVALGCAVSILVGGLFWPRGAAAVVGNDLADAFRSGSTYLTQAVGWVSGLRPREPDGAMNAVNAGLRLEEALRGLLSEQGTKHMKKEELWRLVGGTLRLRLTAHAVAGLPRTDAREIGASRAVLSYRTAVLDEFFDQIATQVGKPRGQPVSPLTAPTFDGDRLESSAHSHQTVWLCEHVDHLTEHLEALIQPAVHLAEVRRRPWWR